MEELGLSAKKAFAKIAQRTQKARSALGRFYACVNALIDKGRFFFLLFLSLRDILGSPGSQCEVY